MHQWSNNDRVQEIKTVRVHDVFNAHRGVVLQRWVRELHHPSLL